MSEESTVGGLLAVLAGIVLVLVPTTLGLTAAVYFAAVGDGSTANDVFWDSLQGIFPLMLTIALIPVAVRIVEVYNSLQAQAARGEDLDGRVAVEVFGIVLVCGGALVLLGALLSGCGTARNCDHWEYTLVLTEIPVPIATILSSGVAVAGMFVMGVGVVLQSMTPADDGDDEVSGYV